MDVLRTRLAVHVGWLPGLRARADPATQEEPEGGHGDEPDHHDEAVIVGRDVVEQRVGGDGADEGTDDAEEDREDPLHGAAGHHLRRAAGRQRTRECRLGLRRLVHLGGGAVRRVGGRGLVLAGALGVVGDVVVTRAVVGRGRVELLALREELVDLGVDLAGGDLRPADDALQAPAVPLDLVVDLVDALGGGPVERLKRSAGLVGHAVDVVSGLVDGGHAIPLLSGDESRSA